MIKLMNLRIPSIIVKNIIECEQRAKPRSEDMLSDLQKIEYGQYDNVSDVTKAAGLVSQ